MTHRLRTHDQLLARWLYDIGSSVLRAGLPQLPSEAVASVHEREKAAHKADDATTTAEDEAEDEAEDDRSSIYDSEEEAEDDPSAELLDEQDGDCDVDATAVNGDVHAAQNVRPTCRRWSRADAVSPITQPEPDVALKADADSGARAVQAGEDVNIEASTVVLEVDDTPSDDERAAAFEACILPHVPKSRARSYRKWQAEGWACLQEDFERLDSRDRWLSGDGLAVFAAAKLKEVGVSTVGLIHPGLLQEVQWRMDSLAAGDVANSESNKRSITAALHEVRAPRQREIPSI